MANEVWKYRGEQMKNRRYVQEYKKEKADQRNGIKK